MDRNLRHTHSSYGVSGPRSLPLVSGSKARPPARLSPPAELPQHNNQHDDLINYIYDAWNKVNREVERGSEDTKYFQETPAPRQLANFRPFNLEEWWARRVVHKQQHPHRS